MAAARLAAWLRRPVDASSSNAFRVLFGAVMAAAMLRLLASGWIDRLFVQPRLHLAYPGFGWLRPWPRPLMVAHVAVLAALAVGMAAGVRSRLCAALFALGFAALELMDRALYLNHYYLATLLAALIAALPVHRAPARVVYVPRWVLAALRAQVAIVYCYAGVAKLNGDWLLRAQPLRTWLAARADLPVIGGWLELPAVAYAASWAGALFDLTIVPLLAVRRTRRPAFAALVGFHLATGALFPIGMFPWIMIAAATLWLPADWPRRFLAARGARQDEPAVAGRRLPALVAAHLLVQALLPLRQQLSREPSAWTGRGFDFAWNVMAAERAGAVTLTAIDRATGARRALRTADYLAAWQEPAMAQDPALILAFARLVAADIGAPSGAAVAITADAHLALNGRPPRRLLDPTVDLVTATAAPVLPFEPASDDQRRGSPARTATATSGWSENSPSSPRP